MVEPVPLQADPGEECALNALPVVQKFFENSFILKFHNMSLLCYKNTHSPQHKLPHE